MVSVTNIFGYSAAVSLIVTMLPQLYFTWRTKKMDDISYIFLGMQLLTCFLFLIYGILLNEIPLILANSLVASQSLTLCIFKYSYSKNTIQ